MKGIRNNYCELLLSLTFFFHDEQLKKRISKRKSFVGFENYRIFRTDFARKSFDFLQFVISDRKIQGKSLISDRSETLARNLIYFFSIRQDPSVKSLKLTEEPEMKYFIDYLGFFFTRFDKKIEEIVIQIQAQFRNNENLFNLEDIFKNTGYQINNLIDYLGIFYKK